jgi:23S rRNA (adenine2503-C2)-methyltransferase
MHGGYVGAIERCHALYRDGRADQPHLHMPIPPVSRLHESDSPEGVVRKFTLPLSPKADDAKRAAPGAQLETESVIIPMIGKKRIRTHTLCVSSQVGCAMGCVFCQTAQMGLIRHLTADEIVQQWWVARHRVPGFQSSGALGCDTITNIVFMGMGEPMDNLDNVLAAIAILTDHHAVGLPMSKITISTVGRIDGIARLAAHINTPGWHRLNLAISLNAPNDEIRSQIMPINKAMPMRELRAALEAWPIYGAAKLCLEYVLIPGVNDHQDHARQLADFVLGRAEYAGRPPLPGLVNVIPYNPRENSPWPAPTEAAADLFLAQIHEQGVFAKRRRTKGRDQMAACGQLGNPALRKQRATVGITVANT